ncbi:hypothetical protein Ddc_07496 [Ditylenchus destructor]|nr:hypothetical protein Ddc_07496 [Ditylenchus destructor]
MRLQDVRAMDLIQSSTYLDSIGEVITRPAELFIPPPPPLETHFEISEQNHIKTLPDRGDTPVKERIEQLKAQSFDPRPKTRKAPAPPKPLSPQAPQGSPKSKMDPTDIEKADSPNTPLSPKAQEIQKAKMLVQEIKHNLLFKAKSEGHSSSVEVRQRAQSDAENCQNEKCDIEVSTERNAPVEEQEESEDECTFTRL